MPGRRFTQLPWAAQTVEAEHGHDVGIVGVVPLRENGVVFCREEFIVQKTLPVMISLPGKSVQQDVGGRFLNVLPVGGVPQGRQRGRRTSGPELRPHRLGDVVDQRKQAGGRVRLCLHPDGLQCKAVQEHITAQRQALGSHRKQAQLPAVVKGTAANDLQAIRQGHLFHKAAAHGVQVVGVRRRGVKVKIVPAGTAAHHLSEGPGQPDCTGIIHLIAADGIRCRQTAGLFGEAVVPQLGDGPAASRRGRNAARQYDAGVLAVHPHQPRTACFQRQNLQHHPVFLHHSALPCSSVFLLLPV